MAGSDGAGQIVKWLDDLKIAVVEEDEGRLSTLIDKMPKEMALEEARVAVALIAQARIFLERKRAETLVELQKLAEFRERQTVLPESGVDDIRLDLIT